MDSERCCPNKCKNSTIIKHGSAKKYKKEKSYLVPRFMCNKCGKTMY